VCLSKRFQAGGPLAEARSHATTAIERGKGVVVELSHRGAKGKKRQAWEGEGETWPDIVRTGSLGTGPSIFTSPNEKRFPRDE
jgi:hypothetical protein